MFAEPRNSGLGQYQDQMLPSHQNAPHSVGNLIATHLEQEVGMKQQLVTPHKMNRETIFTTTKYMVCEKFADLLGLEEPITRKECQMAFINYAINQDFIDLKNH